MNLITTRKTTRTLLASITAAGMLALAATDANADTNQNFDVAGTPYVAANDYSSFGPDAPGVLPGGPTGSYYRLTGSTSFTQNSIAFDRTYVGSSPSVELDFDFRYSELDTSSAGADGIGVVLLDTSVYGTTGAAPRPSSDGWEEPNFTNSFGFGLDSFANAEGGFLNSFRQTVTLHYNGAVLVERTIDQAAINLDNGVFNHVHVTIDWVTGGANVTLQITDGTDSIVETIYNDYYIDGMLPYESRLAMGARTGGYYMAQDVDNINLAFVPEPSSLALLGLGGLVFARRRRR